MSRAAAEDEIREIIKSLWSGATPLVARIRATGATRAEVMRAYAAASAVKRTRPSGFAAAAVFDILVDALGEDLRASLLEGLRDDGYRD